MFASLNSTSTSTIIRTLQSWFNVMGWPRAIRSDGGPQFHGEFASFCIDFGIKYELASPYNQEGKDIQRVLIEWRTCQSSTAILLLSLCSAGVSSCCYLSRLVLLILLTMNKQLLC